jgi:dihydroorotate dehydrogenase
MSLYNLFKSVAFKIDPEKIHEMSMGALSKFPNAIAGMFDPIQDDPRFHLKVGSLTWKFPIGLAAGLDKNAGAIDFFSQLGFGAIEVGTVTPRPQEGNPKPRLFRYPDEKSLRNRMGFNNLGSDAILENVRAAEKNGKLLGVNLGKNKDTPADKAWEDYQILYKKFAPHADYLVINVSSPNTPGLRDLQQKEGLKIILDALEDERKREPKPLFVKVSPDAAFEDLDEIIQLASNAKLEGLIATNTTIMSDWGEGGMSGRLLRDRAKEVRTHILQNLPEDLQLIGVGGISNIEDLASFWAHGGRVAQIYTSFIYEGPEIIRNFYNDILDLFSRYGVDSLEELIEAIREERMDQTVTRIFR